MKVGDLVRYSHTDDRDAWPPGIIIGFDEDADPIVWFTDAPQQPAAYFRQDMEVIGENR